MAVKYETPTSSVDENALIENFDYEENSDNTSFQIPSIEELENSFGSITTVSSDDQNSIITIESDSEDELVIETPTVKPWIEVLQFNLTEALSYKNFLYENIVDIPEIFRNIVNDQLYFIEKYFN